MIFKKSILVIFFFLLAFAPFVYGDGLDEYKPYLHKSTVPEHPKLKLQGNYQTNIFPGAGTYTFPIELPKGTNDLSPKLSISYNSQRAKQRPGILGAGWELTQNYIYRHVNHSLSDDSDDYYVLVKDNTPHELVYIDNIFHTKIETHLKIQNLTGADNIYGTYWLITQKDGTKYRFGFNNDSELVSNMGHNHALKWSLDKINDTHGNSITYSYLEDPNNEDNGTVYLKEILYNNEESRKVVLTYESSERPDKRLVYEHGNLFYESRRLKRISTFAHDSIIRRYNIDFINLNDLTSLTAISSIILYGSDNSSLLTNTSFEYHNPKINYTYSANYYKPPYHFGQVGINDMGIRFADINNDGFIDIIRGRKDTLTKNISLNNRKGEWVDLKDYDLPLYINKPDQSPRGVRFVDFNSDGFTDILYAQNDGGDKKAYVNTGAGWIHDQDWISPVDFQYADSEAGVRLADVNGDGRIDLLRSDAVHGKRAYRNTGSGWELDSTWNPPRDFINDKKDYGIRVVDLNGDGLADVLEANQFGTPYYNRS